MFTEEEKREGRERREVGERWGRHREGGIRLDWRVGLGGGERSM